MKFASGSIRRENCGPRKTREFTEKAAKKGRTICLASKSHLTILSISVDSVCSVSPSPPAPPPPHQRRRQFIRIERRLYPVHPRLFSLNQQHLRHIVPPLQILRTPQQFNPRL